MLGPPLPPPESFLDGRAAAGTLRSMKKPPPKVADIIEWVIITGVVVALAFIFFTHNGFIGHSDIQAYPY